MILACRESNITPSQSKITADILLLFILLFPKKISRKGAKAQRKPTAYSQSDKLSKAVTPAKLVLDLIGERESTSG